MDGKKIDQLCHEAPEDREAPPPAGGMRGVLAPALRRKARVSAPTWSTRIERTGLDRASRM